jgi:hypothetical protein
LGLVEGGLGCGGGGEGDRAAAPAMASDRWQVKALAQLQNWLKSCDTGQQKHQE